MGGPCEAALILTHQSTLVCSCLCVRSYIRVFYCCGTVHRESHSSLVLPELYSMTLHDRWAARTLGGYYQAVNQWKRLPSRFVCTINVPDCWLMCVYAAYGPARHLLSFGPDWIYTKTKASWPMCCADFFFFLFKPEKAVKKTIEGTDVECAGLNLEVFSPPDTPGSLESFWIKKKSSRDCGGQETTPYRVVWVFVYREKVDKKFIDACLYVKDRMEEVSSPDKEMVSGFIWLWKNEVKWKVYWFLCVC